MSQIIKKSVLCDLVSRHSDFNYESYVANTPLDDFDVWNGYCLPMHYTNVGDEYAAIRNRCALFDASPMKKYRFRGDDAGLFLDRILTAPVSQLAAMSSAYGLICNEQGLLLDDGIVNKYEEDNYLLLISELDLDEHFAQYNDFVNLVISEETDLSAGLALQGPRACEVLNCFGFAGIEYLDPFALQYFDLSGHKITVGRLGFTGDLGYELWFSPEAKDAVQRAFVRAENTLNFDIPGYGLSALQICRIEAGMIVPGWDTAGEFGDLELERSPYELALGWNVKLEREEMFSGKTALVERRVQGPRYRMKGFIVDSSCILVEGQAVYTKVEGELNRVGALPSLVWHTRDKVWIGFASLTAANADIEDVFIKLGEQEIPCLLCNIPFIDLKQRNQVPAPM